VKPTRRGTCGGPLSRLPDCGQYATKAAASKAAEPLRAMANPDDIRECHNYPP